MQRVGPVLDADRLAVEAVVGVGDVAGGEHTGRGGVQVLVDPDPVVDHQPGVGRESGAGLHPDSDDHEVALERTPVAVRTRSTTRSPSKASTLVPDSIRTP